MRDLADTGRVIAGRYRLESPVGRGAMGIVWRARDQLLDRDVAVKEVQMADTLTESERANAYQRTLREAKTAARLSHPGVVSVYDVADDGGRPWIVMELVNARSLDQVLAADGPLPPRQTAEMGRQLLSALSVAHGAGVLHRDVKPSNVLLGTDGRAVLTDFGIATFQGDPKLTQTGMVMGSPGFTAPERIRGGGATPASDLWSLGATLFAAVEGHGPFESRGGAITTMSAIINEDAPPASAAGALGRVIDALLRREPADRPDAMTASRMISDVLHLPPSPSPSSPGVGYEPTAMSAASPAGRAEGVSPGVVPGGEPLAAETCVDVPSGSGSGLGSGSGGPPTAATTPQPDLGFGAAPGTGVPGTGVPGTGVPGTGVPGTGVPGTAGPDGPAGSRFAMPPAPDFSSWYNSTPRSGGARSPSGYAPHTGPGGPGAPAWPVADPEDPATWRPPPRRASSGLRWKLALAALAVIGAGVGAAAIILFRSHGTTPAAQSSTLPTSSTDTGTGTTSPTTPVSINMSIDRPVPSGSAIPAGFKPYSLTGATAGTAAGFTIDYPAGWDVVHVNSVRTRFQDPDQSNTYLLVDLTSHTFKDMLKEASYIEQRSLAQGSFPGYHRIGLARLKIRGHQGAYWKFTWDDNGVEQEALDLMYIASTPAGPQSYALLFTTTKEQWNPMHAYFDVEAETFATSPRS